jgi:hypothetical protein
MGLIQYLYTELTFFLTLRTMHTLRASIFDRTTQTNEGEWNYPPTDTVLETAGLRPIEENIRRRRDTALCFASERYAIYTGNVWHPFL